jgi:hypothetical protein
VFAGVHYLYLDFSTNGGLSPFKKQKNLPVTVILGLCLAAAFFFQSNVGTLLALLSKNWLECVATDFTLDNVAELIVSQLNGATIALLWHFNEFHHLDNIYLQAIINVLGGFMIAQKYPQISISPIFSGTASRHISAALRISTI